MIEAPTSVCTLVGVAAGDLLDLLVERIAAGDRAAFRSLYAFLALRVLCDAARSLPRPADARAVTRATFVEVWHLAGQHVERPRMGTRDWLAAITAQRVDERRPATEPQCPIFGDYDRLVHRELVALLGPGPAIIRAGAETFIRVDDLTLTP